MAVEMACIVLQWLVIIVEMQAAIPVSIPHPR